MVLLENLQMTGTDMGYRLYLMVGKMLKATHPLINILGVSASGVVFLLAHDYTDRYKIDINIVDDLINTIQEIGLYNIIQVNTDNAANCKAT
jgi:hypothetical protein